MRKTILLFLGIIFIFTSLVSAQSYTGIITVDSVSAKPGNHFGVKVRISDNNLAFSAMTIPLSYLNSDLTLDSVSYEGSIKPVNFNGITYIDQAAKKVIITYLAPVQFPLPLETISTTNGIIAELFFTLASGAAPQAIVIDKIESTEQVNYNGVDKWIQTGVYISDNSGTAIFTPDFVPGKVVVVIPTAVIEDNNSLLPNEFALEQNYPNPFNPATTIEFSLPSSGQTKLEVFNILGQNVATLVDGIMTAGNHKVEFDASRQPSGIYFYRLEHERGSDTKKMILVK